MKNLLYIAFCLLFTIISLNIKAQNESRNLDFKSTRLLLETNPDSANQKIENFKSIPYQYKYLKGIYYKQKKDYQKSKSYLLASIKENKNSETPEYVDAYYYIGYNYQHLGLLDSAGRSRWRGRG